MKENKSFQRKNTSELPFNLSTMIYSRMITYLFFQIESVFANPTAKLHIYKLHIPRSKLRAPVLYLARKDRNNRPRYANNSLIINQTFFY